MWTTAHIRRQLARMIGTKPFSIRDFLAFGARAAVDQAFARLVKNGEVIRIARGIYIKPNSPLPSAFEVALVKAAAFRRIIAVHGARAALHLKICGNSIENQSNNEYVFACSGRSSSFRFGNQVIRYVGTSARKLHFGDSRPGLAIRSLWHLGKNICTMEMASQAVRPFFRSDHQEFKQQADIMPAWMQELFLSIKRYWEEQRRREATDPIRAKAMEAILCPALLRRQAFPHLEVDS
jgi:hypothetical protein